LANKFGLTKVNTAISSDFLYIKNDKLKGYY